MPREIDFQAPPPDGSFDAVAALAARRCGAGIALVRLDPLDGASAPPTLAESSLSTFNMSGIALSRAEIERLATPEATITAGMGFFVGLPVRAETGEVLGALAVLDREPRDLDDATLADLKLLARVVADSVALRREAGRQIASENVGPRA